MMVLLIKAFDVRFFTIQTPKLSCYVFICGWHEFDNQQMKKSIYDSNVDYILGYDILTELIT